MLYGRLPHLDKDISRLIVGADWFQEAEEAKAVEVLDAFVEAGGNCIDMAHCYGGGQGQRIVGRWLRARGNRDNIVLLDKGCHPYDGRNRVTPKDLDDDLSENLRRLQVDHIDLFILHRDDPAVEVGPIIERLNDHREAGRISAFGGSNWSHTRIREANAWAEHNGMQGFALSNPNLCLAGVNEARWEGCLTVQKDGRIWHAQMQFPLFSWSAQGAGFFAGIDSEDVRRVYWNAENFARKVRAGQMAARKKASALNIALAWVLSQPFPVWALIGPRTVDELHACMPALGVELNLEELFWLEHGDLR